jgi:hypothetical protein
MVTSWTGQFRGEHFGRCSRNRIRSAPNALDEHANVVGFMQIQTFSNIALVITFALKERFPLQADCVHSL